MIRLADFLTTLAQAHGASVFVIYARLDSDRSSPHHFFFVDRQCEIIAIIAFEFLTARGFRLLASEARARNFQPARDFARAQGYDV